MASPWKRNVRTARRILVLNSAGAWSGDVDRAISTFNSLPFNVTLELTTEERQANVVVKLADVIGTHTFNDRFYGQVTVTATFAEPRAHGKTKVVKDSDRGFIVMAAVFLPGRLEGTSPGIKEIVAVHEFIHAAGMDDDEADHDTRDGVFYRQMEMSNGMLSEWGLSNPPMPPIRVGANTVCRLNMLWSDDATCD